MATMHFIGLDIHKKAISYCIKDPHGTVLREGSVAATLQGLDVWMKSLPQPWTVAMERSAIRVDSCLDVLSTDCYFCSDSSVWSRDGPVVAYHGKGLLPL